MDFQLRPCRMCGSSDVELKDVTSTLYSFDIPVETITAYYVACNNCGITSLGYDTEEEAAEKWNCEELIELIIPSKQESILLRSICKKDRE